MKFNCGHCGELTATTVQAENNYETYRNNGYDIPCQHCGEYNRINFKREIAVLNVKPIEEDRVAYDFPYNDFTEKKSRKRPKKKDPKVEPALNTALNFLLEKDKQEKRRRGSTRS